VTLIHRRASHRRRVHGAVAGGRCSAAVGEIEDPATEDGLHNIIGKTGTPTPITLGG
jgi:hypothetical protein